MLTPQNNVSNGCSFGLKTNFVNHNNFGMKNNNTTAYYAKKGEPMYMKEMDADEDGIVSFDEFKDYCQANGISVKEMVKMAELAASYRTRKAQERAEDKIQNKSENKSDSVEDAAVYAKRGDAKYDEVMDTNNDDKVSYKEYIEYCKEHAKPQEEKANTKVEKTEDGEFKTTSLGKAINSYSKNESEIQEFKNADFD